MSIVQVALDVPLPRLFDYLGEGVTTQQIGSRVLVPFGGSAHTVRKSVGVIMNVVETSRVDPKKLKPVTSLLADTPSLPMEWLGLMKFCADYYHRPIGEVVMAALPPRLRTARPAPPSPSTFRLARPLGEILESLAVRASRKRQLIESWSNISLDDAVVATMSAAERTLFRSLLKSGDLERHALAPSSPAFLEVHPLNQEQTSTVRTIAQGLDSFSVHLLFGVTGSGKTEIYLHLINKVLQSRRQALVLVPEIALTPALQAAFSARFPGARIVMQHSAMSEMERARAWLDAQEGIADIILGTRLAAFVPLARPGLIVIDEEQDGSFKQQEGLRYSARDLGVFRARSFGIPVILASATPSLETYYHAGKGRYWLHRLNARAHARAAMPVVHLVDTAKFPVSHGLSEPVAQALATRLQGPEQSMVFLNRRGYAPVLACPSCGWISDCADCAAHLVVHLSERRLRCHHCGRSEPVPRACPRCGNVDLQPLGRGTQRLEDTLAERFPSARILRIDGDSTRRRGSLESMLDEVRSGRANLLVGTQILAKGHHFENLTLVVILNADAGLFAADYRASERLFAQLEQVAGRAGRAERPGEVWIQTRFPQHPVYQALRTHDYSGFAQALLAEREQAGFPPFVFEAALRAEAPDIALAEAFLQQTLAAAPADRSGITLFKPVPLALPRMAKMERIQLVMQSASRSRLQAFLGEWMPRLYELRSRGVRWHIDVDPTEF